MKEKFWKARYVAWIMYRTSFVVTPTVAWSFAGGWVESFGIEENSPKEAVDEELSCWG